MSSILNKGTVFDTKDELQAAILRTTTSTTKDFRIQRNTKLQYQAVCYSNKGIKGWKNNPSTCPWMINAKPLIRGNHDGKWIVNEVISHHSCCDSEAKRKRNYSTKTITTASSVVKSFIPSKKRLGSTQQLINMAKESDGITLKKSHAHNVVQDKALNSVPIHIGQYLLLKDYFAFLSAKDETGTFVLETQTCTWDESLEQFKRCYVCFSFVRIFWSNNGCIPLFAVDGTFTTTGIIKHTLLFAVSYDGNNELVHLAYCICDIENTENWLWFLDKLISDFPGSYCCLADFDKGLQSEEVQNLLLSENIKFSRCVRHMQPNCKQAHPIGSGKNCEYEKITMKLAKARSEQLFHIHLEELGDKIGIEQKEWWFERRNQYATICFLEKGIQRYLKVLSNGAEQMNSVHKDARCEPLLSLMKSLCDWNLHKFTVRKNKANQWVNRQQQLTDYAHNKHNKAMDEGSRRNVALVQWNEDHSEVSGNVSKVSSAFSAVDVSINVTHKIVDCECNYMKETGMICLHALALIAHEEEIDFNVMEWYEQKYHAEHYLDCYSVNLPSLAIDRYFNVTKIVPPQHKVTSGRPRTKRYVSTSDKKRVCRACGVAGHHQSTCSNPSTKVRWTNYKDDAIAWAKAFTTNLFDH